MFYHVFIRVGANVVPMGQTQATGHWARLNVDLFGIKSGISRLTLGFAQWRNNRPRSGQLAEGPQKPLELIYNKIATQKDIRIEVYWSPCKIFAGGPP